ncbi:MAG: septal ring lytic transglycosylase RlpA family protein [Hamadaea sp.]|nr:septal ring lytic transglycosylase RlpA family protein [Hamadaea sp.]
MGGTGHTRKVDPVAGRHAAGKPTRRIPLTREPRASEPQAREPQSQYQARHALNRRRRPIVAPLATATALTVAAIGAAGLSQAGAPEKTSTPDETAVDTYQQQNRAASRSTTRPSPRPSPSAKRKVTASGTCGASFYGVGQGTASGERFDPTALTAAHKTWKFGTRVRVTNPRNGKSVIVRINDRGPYIDGRCIDLSKAAFAAIENTSRGVMTVRYEIIT